MHKFAHLADCHLGANREPVLQNLELTAFKKTLDKCMGEKVDFIIISGDLFHVNIPDMSVVNESVKKIKEVQDSGIPVYVIYGSHDYSPNETSMVDVLESAGLVKKIVKGYVEEDKLRLEFFTDPKTGAKLVGISGRKMGLEKNYFEILDRESLERETGFKIFVFHNALSELKPEYLAGMESIPVSLLPRGFDYYAAGHVHQHAEAAVAGYERIVYPGPIFAGYPRDFEVTAKGEKRGFYIVSFNEKVDEVKFVEIQVCDSTYIEYDVSHKNSTQAQKELSEKLENAGVENKLVVLRIRGELSGGKTSDIGSSQLRSILMGKGAVYVSINRYGLTSKEYAMVKVMGEDMPTIEKTLFSENIGTVKVTNDDLKGEKGVHLATGLLKVVRQEQKFNEAKKDYESHVRKDALDALQLKEGPS